VVSQLDLILVTVLLLRVATAAKYLTMVDVLAGVKSVKVIQPASTVAEILRIHEVVSGTIVDRVEAMAVQGVKVRLMTGVAILVDHETMIVADIHEDHVGTTAATVVMIDVATHEGHEATIAVATQEGLDVMTEVRGVTTVVETHADHDVTIGAMVVTIDEMILVDHEVMIVADIQEDLGVMIEAAIHEGHAGTIVDLGVTTEAATLADREEMTEVDIQEVHNEMIAARGVTIGADTLVVHAETIVDQGAMIEVQDVTVEEIGQNEAA